MKYKTRIIPEGNGYVGQIYTNEDIVYVTEVLADPVVVTRQMSNYIYSLAQDVATPQAAKPFPSTVSVEKAHVVIPGQLSNTSNRTLPPAPIPTQPIYAPPRRCCGRG